MALSEYLERHECARPDLRMVEENEFFRTFYCLTCHEQWTITRNKVKKFAREENRLDQIRVASEAEARKVKIFGPYYRGVKSA